MTQPLLEIQSLDVEARQLRHRRENLESQAQLDKALAEQQQRQAEIDVVSVARVEVMGRQKRHEDEAAIVSGKADKDNARLYSGEVTGNKELQALQHEIATLRERQSGIEEQALEAMLEADDMNDQMEALKAAMASIDERVTVLQAEVASQTQEIDDALAVLLSRRGELASEVDASWLAEYERLSPDFGTSTVVSFDGHKCVGCPLVMPSVEVDRIKHEPGTDPLVCGECTRIVLR